MINISEHVGTGRKVRITRNRPSAPLLNGYILAASQHLALAHCFDDFEPDGFTVFRLKDVVGLRQGKYELFWDYMLEGEGLLGGLRAPPRMDLSSIAAAIRGIAAEYRFMTIKCEDAEEAIEDFYIGQPVDVGEDVIRFRHFDGVGQWESEPCAIDVEGITWVEFASPYIRHFSKYVR